MVRGGIDAVFGGNHMQSARPHNHCNERPSAVGISFCEQRFPDNPYRSLRKGVAAWVGLLVLDEGIILSTFLLSRLWLFRKRKGGAFERISIQFIARFETHSREMIL